MLHKLQNKGIIQLFENLQLIHDGVSCISPDYAHLTMIMMIIIVIFMITMLTFFAANISSAACPRRYIKKRAKYIS